jgi:hypothetical protein
MSCNREMHGVESRVVQRLIQDFDGWTGGDVRFYVNRFVLQKPFNVGFDDTKECVSVLHVLCHE